MITRFAPSPTGPLHLGHAYSAILAHDMARAAGGQFLLRIDDLDQSRARPEWEELIYEDLRWLGLSWDGLRRQSDHFDSYRDAIQTLADTGAVYPCRCSRADITAAASAPQEGVPEFGPDGRIYPGTCRDRAYSERTDTDALRYDLSKAIGTPSQMPTFTETGPAHEGTHKVTAEYLMSHVGDPILARPNLAASYHLSVVIDDAESHVTNVTRGKDLYEATYLQRFLQWKLSLTPPIYHHHRLIRDDAGKRLAKRDDARAIRTYRAEGASPQDIRHMVGL
ncbi:tRNA glutamyl-Q(34) synthetase GluQRS [Gymnodinialimonas ceratoperidinii]|uniref:tRNA glutamyl-Q(34) synthetase GluQRS n=1 Tax=Gymnodinialimonas ceratoperidinii TaxID=2856823 RepID=A0A8F6TUR4_9RHOB|nr:tRNA glutamyl-Q(34) synthetase GluQRS [Gymnodinialimonas ceratoperidinii]QXT38509.1 tRNA glutamyl-Q(34) synthetase GluQRS [Gymnodinialimonas ceratoperidinii]